MKITKEQIEKASKSEYQSIDQSQLGAMIMKYEREAFTKGANWAISQMQPEWVACSDQLPPSMEHVLCYVNGEVHSRLFSRGWSELSNEEFIERCQVTHWMPFPQPPTK